MRRVIFFTGAGISAESGVPTFRTGSDAVWENHSINDVCNIDTFERNYALVHQFYNQRRTALAGVKPNPAHHAIAAIQQAHPDRVILMTSNVDDLHERAGSRNVRHIHGNLLEMVDLESREIFPLGYEAFDYASQPPKFKPNVVFFGEMAPVYQELFALMDNLSEEDLVVVVGSSESVIAFCAEAYMGSQGAARILYVDPCEKSVYDGRSLIPYERHFRTSATEAFAEGGHLMDRIKRWLD
ncbi:SIR2 family NAD-dependent protein deacylase [Marinobacterium sp. YM272]|uniref:SIR2 family NAD-dependent protein deacylase n=1 Tax=Marinobacterium sp. YM272 TaxID=3421654 RepID=UPI003D7F2FB8